MSEDEYDALSDKEKAEVDRKRLEIKKERIRKSVFYHFICMHFVLGKFSENSKTPKFSPCNLFYSLCLLLQYWLFAKVCFCLSII